MPETFAPSPPGMLVPYGGSSCASCIFVAEEGPRCLNPHYISLKYKGKKSGDDRFIDGKTGEVVEDRNEFCCNVYDWER